MSWYDEVAGFVTKNKDILKPLATAGVSAYKNVSQDNATKDYQNYLAGQEKNNYQNYLNEVDNYNAQGAAAAANAGANRAAAAANANARAGAAAATDKARRKAAGKANVQSQKGYAEALAMLAPYLQAGKEILPAKSATYLDALKRMGQLGDYLDSPEQKANANASIPSYEVPVQLPDYLLKK